MYIQDTKKGSYIKDVYSRNSEYSGIVAWSACSINLSLASEIQEVYLKRHQIHCLISTRMYQKYDKITNCAHCMLELNKMAASATFVKKAKRSLQQDAQKDVDESIAHIKITKSTNPKP